MRWRENKGAMPRSLKGKRVVVQLRNGEVCGDKPVNPYSPPGWAADGRGGLRWSLTGDAFDVVLYRSLGE